MENEKGGAYSMHGREEKYVHDFCQKTWNEERPLGCLGIEGRIILECISKKQGVNVWTLFI
jgi:hypothetical protein